MGSILDFSGTKKKEKEIQKEIDKRFGISPYDGEIPKFCKFDGKILLESNETVDTFFDEKSGLKKKKVKYFRYCPDWKTNRPIHTEYWGRIIVEDNA